MNAINCTFILTSLSSAFLFACYIDVCIENTIHYFASLASEPVRAYIYAYIYTYLFYIVSYIYLYARDPSLQESVVRTWFVDLESARASFSRASCPFFFLQPKYLSNSRVKVHTWDAFNAAGISFNRARLIFNASYVLFWKLSNFFFFVSRSLFIYLSRPILNDEKKTWLCQARIAMEMTTSRLEQAIWLQFSARNPKILF